MKVKDCMKEIRKAKDALDTLDRYARGEMCGIANQHIEEIKDVIGHYIELIEEKVAT